MLDEARIEPDADPYRLYAIIRRDLNMPPGKLAAQAGHAFCDALDIAAQSCPDISSLYRTGRHGIKVCLAAKNEHAILRAYEEAQRAGIPAALIIDQHHILPPHFDGSPIITALGLGPARRSEINHITKRFSALQ